MAPIAAGISASAGLIGAGCASVGAFHCAGMAGGLALRFGGIAAASNTWLAARGRAPWTAPLADISGIGFSAVRFLPKGLRDEMLGIWPDVVGGIAWASHFVLGELSKLWLKQGGGDGSVFDCSSAEW